jgi:hypothetical protein
MKSKAHKHAELEWERIGKKFDLVEKMGWLKYITSSVCVIGYMLKSGCGNL